jgi:hypothetical protein
MTPPDTDLKKQKRRHWPVFWGIVAAAALAVLAWFAFVGFRADMTGTALTDDIVEPATGNDVTTETD